MWLLVKNQLSWVKPPCSLVSWGHSRNQSGDWGHHTSYGSKSEDAGWRLETLSPLLWQSEQEVWQQLSPSQGLCSTLWIKSTPSCTGKQVSQDRAELLFGTEEGCVPLMQQKKLGQAEGNSLLKAGLVSERTLSWPASIQVSLKYNPWVASTPFAQCWNRASWVTSDKGVPSHWHWLCKSNFLGRRVQRFGFSSLVLSSPCW